MDVGEAVAPSTAQSSSRVRGSAKWRRRAFGPWWIVPLFLAFLNIELLPLFQPGRAVAPSPFIIAGLAIFWACTRHGARGVAPSLIVTGLFLIELDMGVLSLSTSDVLGIPLLYLAMRYALAPAEAVAALRALRRGRRDLLLFAVLATFGISVTFAEVTLNLKASLAALLILPLILGPVPLKPAFPVSVMWPYVLVLLLSAAVQALLAQVPLLPSRWSFELRLGLPYTEGLLGFAGAWWMAAWTLSLTERPGFARAIGVAVASPAATLVLLTLPLEPLNSLIGQVETPIFLSPHASFVFALCGIATALTGRTALLLLGLPLWVALALPLIAEISSFSSGLEVAVLSLSFGMVAAMGAICARTLKIPEGGTVADAFLAGAHDRPADDRPTGRGAALYGRRGERGILRIGGLAAVAVCAGTALEITGRSPQSVQVPLPAPLRELSEELAEPPPSGKAQGRQNQPLEFPEVLTLPPRDALRELSPTGPADSRPRIDEEAGALPTVPRY
jgi:hypothetical protein